MLSCVYGEDDFRVSQKVKQLKDHFIKKFDGGGMNTSSFEHKDEPGVVISAIKSGGLLSPKRFIIIHGLVEATKAPDVDTWVDTLCTTDDDTIVILRESVSKVKFHKQPLGKELKDAVSRYDYDFPVLSGSQLSTWVSHEASSLGATIQPAAVQRLVAFVGSDTWQLHQELRKLVGLSDGSVITKEIVSEVVHANFEDRIFDFVDAVSKKQTVPAIRLLFEERKSGANDGYMFSMLMRQVRILLGIRDLLDRKSRLQKDEAAKELSVPPFVAQKAIQQAQRYQTKNLVYAHDLLFNLERKIKTGQIKPDDALERLLTELLK